MKWNGLAVEWFVCIFKQYTIALQPLLLIVGRSLCIKSSSVLLNGQTCYWIQQSKMVHFIALLFVQCYYTYAITRLHPANEWVSISNPFPLKYHVQNVRGTSKWNQLQFLLHPSLSNSSKIFAKSRNYTHTIGFSLH